jgi:hypothetical protein
MSFRENFTVALKASMLASDTARTSTLRMILARIKDADIAGRPKHDQISDDEIVGVLRGMVKSRRESAELYVRGDRPELASKEEAEIVVIEGFLPVGVTDSVLADAIEVAICTTEAKSIKEMGKVMAILKAQFGASLDMSKASQLVKARLV